MFLGSEAVNKNQLSVLAAKDVCRIENRRKESGSSHEVPVNGGCIVIFCFNLVPLLCDLFLLKCLKEISVCLTCLCLLLFSLLHLTLTLSVYLCPPHT